MESTRWKRPQPWAGVALLLAVGASLALLFAPLSTQVESIPCRRACTVAVPEPPGGSEPKVTHPSLLQTNGWTVVLPLGIPVVLAGAGVLAAVRQARRWLVVIAALLGAFVVLGALSVGIFYLPAEAVMIVAAVKERRP